MSTRRQLRKLLKSPGVLCAPGAYDTWSARLIEQAGFPLVYLTGYGVSASLLGKPDLGYLTLTEMTARVRSIAGAVQLPVIADADTGFGGELNVARTVQEYEAAGAAALHLEDQVFPKRCGHMDGKQVIPAADHAAKIRAAVEARRDPNLVLIARTDARAVFGIEEAIARGRLYAEAGADLIFVDAPQSIEELKLIATEIPVPVMGNAVEGGLTPWLNLTEWEELGFKLVIYPVTALYTATKAVQNALYKLRQEGTTIGLAKEMVSFSEFNELMRRSGNVT